MVATRQLKSAWRVTKRMHSLKAKRMLASARNRKDCQTPKGVKASSSLKKPRPYPNRAEPLSRESLLPINLSWLGSLAQSSA